MDASTEALELLDAVNQERARLPLFADHTETLFSGEGFERPWAKDMHTLVPWATVEECMQMARESLIAKQRVAEVCLTS